MSWGQIYRVDFGFNTESGFSGAISDKVVQPDGKVVVCGRFTTVNGVPRSSLVRLNQNGSVDTSFIPRIDSPLMTYPPLDVKVKVGLQSNGKVIVAGMFTTSFDNSYSTRTLRANIDGTLDTTFQTTISLPQMANPHFSTMKVMPDNSILIGGFEVDLNHEHYIGNHPFYTNFWPMHENGLTNQPFQNAIDIIGDVKSIEVLPNGKILLGGNLQTFRGRVVSNLVQFNADYTLDTTFNYRSFRDTTGYISDVKALPNGKLVALGNFTSYNGTPCKNIALLNSNGVLDSLNSTLGSGFNNEVTSMMLQPDGKLILGGTFTNYNGVSVPRLIRVYSNGILDTTFRPDAAFLSRVQNPVYTLMSDGNILVSGRISADTNTHIWKL
ncbi:MAG: delta-60 repeat domain-containing protein, partial [Flexibacteraceae bacterium]